ncbi:MAG: alpha/beta fold hydrolase [Myxococcales bacterium]|nr:alpha/beta fold hydrolase [Myxococcales bacterium]
MRRSQARLGPWMLLATCAVACDDRPLKEAVGVTARAKTAQADAGLDAGTQSDIADATDATAAVVTPTDIAMGVDAGAPVVVLPDGFGAADAPAPLPGAATATIGGARPAKVTVPHAWDQQSKWPLVLLLHGFGATGAQQDWYLGISARATTLGFVAVVPEGTKDKVGLQFWNATKACCNFAQNPVDDVAYVTGLIDEAIAKLRVDPTRVYLVGHSNGGFMALRLACQIAPKLTAIATLAGAADMDATACKPAQPVSLLAIHGTLDNVIQFGGGAIVGNPYPSAAVTVAGWVQRNGCPAQGEKLTDVNFEDLLFGKETHRTRWQPCQQGTDVEAWQVDGALHVPLFNDAFRDAMLQHLLARVRVDL